MKTSPRIWDACCWFMAGFIAANQASGTKHADVVSKLWFVERRFWKRSHAVDFRSLPSEHFGGLQL